MTRPTRPGLLLLALITAPVGASARDRGAPAADLCDPSTASAVTPPRLASEGLQRSRTAYGLKGSERLRAFESALHCYQLAEARLAPDAAAELNHPMGLIYAELDRPIEAATAFEHYLDRVPEAQRVPGATADLQRRLEGLRPRVARLAVLAGPGSEVQVDGRTIGTAPLPRALLLTPGMHMVRAGEAQQVVETRAGEGSEVDLRPKAAPLTAPVEPPRAPAPAVVTERVERRPARRPVWRLALGSAGIGAGLLLGGLGVSALAVNGQVIDAAGPTPMRLYSTAGVGAGILAGGAVLLAGGVVLLALPPGHEEKK